ncbi:hypothetical protein PIIN_10279 [Serendipita indica DSM 11827]|uniref:Uncharacterized protein n=1 Tax=Serendipita indica (strain DSM 11827) TaxID=1109443 RepID=G4TY91_SERID|nr:hypothetical protein PIIN_10279 [Serendipita indica DSM 11827]
MFCLRICTLYREKKKTKALILSCFYSSVAFQVVTGGIAISSIKALVGFYGTTCTFSRPPPKNLPTMVAICILSAVLELPCEIVIIVATYLHAREAKQKHFLSHQSVALPILQRMYQDGAIYFLVWWVDPELAFVMRFAAATVVGPIRISLFEVTANYAQWLACPSGLKFVSDPLMYSLSSVISTRFFLGLRQLVPAPTVQAHHTTSLEGSLFVDTYSYPMARTRNVDSGASKLSNALS